MEFIEKILDKIVPKIEVFCSVKLNTIAEEFPYFILDNLNHDLYEIIQVEEDAILIEIKGRTFSPFDLSSVLKNGPQFEEMARVKTKIRVKMQNRMLLISSFEHIVGTKKEKELVKKILTIRLERFVKSLKTEKVLFAV